MSNWPIEKITTHVVDALARPTSIYQPNVEVLNLIRIKGERTQILENAMFSVVDKKWLPDAEGFQLEQLGEIVGESRLGKNDIAYSEALNIRIILNSGGGQPELILTFLRFHLDTEDLRFGEIYPASFMIFVGVSITQDLASRIRRIVGAAIGTIYIAHSNGETPFGFKEEGDSDPDDVLGLGELGLHSLELSDGDLLELNDGNILGLNDSTDLIYTGGGEIAELLEVH